MDPRTHSYLSWLTTSLPPPASARSRAEREALELWSVESGTTWTHAPAPGGPPRPVPAVDLAPPEHAPEPADTLGRYHVLQQLAGGGMGDIRRVYDAHLARSVLQKVLRTTEPRQVERFWVEATVTARLAHPGIVPVHDFGETPDGAPFFTMKEVNGETLTGLVRRLHDASTRRWGRTPDGITLRRGVDVALRVAQVVAYAHDRGIVHRDLKPDNIMVGAFGEVHLLDWGLALVDPRRWLQTLPETDAEGHIAGTIPYMAPEQAMGHVRRCGPWTDVWALGTTLFELLTGHRPYPGQRVGRALLQSIQGGLRPDLEAATRLPSPPALADLCRQCFALEPTARPSADKVVEALEDWLDGDMRRGEARALVAQAESLHPEVARLRDRAHERRAEATAALAAVKSFEPADRKRTGWALEDQAEHLEQQAEATEAERVQLLRAALSRAPDFAPAHQQLADHYRARHERALARGDRRAAVRAEASLRRHDRGAHRAWLDGMGQLFLDTQPSGLTLRLSRLVERDRRLVPDDDEQIVTTPVQGLQLPAGSYVLRGAVVIPVRVPRGGVADGARPGGPTPTPIPVPSPGDLADTECFVPAGWFLFGNPDARGGLPTRRVWVDGFVIDRDPVTNADYIAFLDDLVARGRQAEAEQHLPRELSGSPDGPGHPVYALGDDGRYRMQPDLSGDLWDPRWPVILVTWHDARAYAAWRAERSGLPWRLPWEVEWEKAAAGVDGRAFPWGRQAEPSWFNCHGSMAGRALPATVDAFPQDCSVYGVRGMAGNVRDQVLDARVEGGPEIGADGLWTAPGVGEEDARRVSRGGAWSGSPRFGMCGTRFSMPADHRLALVGFRLCRSWPG